MEERNQPGFNSLMWKPPTRGIIKLNSDAAVRDNWSYLGIMTRNDRGEILEVHSPKICTQSPLVAELMAVKEAMLVCLSNGWKHVECEYNTKSIIQGLNEGNNKGFHWTTKSIFKEIRNLSRHFVNVYFL